MSFPQEENRLGYNAYGIFRNGNKRDLYLLFLLPRSFA